MLDQNTDRLWFVIGAVIVGAALIFLVNSSFPQLFASVGNTFTDKVTELDHTVKHLSNLIEHDVHNIEYSKRINKDTGEWVANDGHVWGDMHTWYSMVGKISMGENQGYHFWAPDGLASPFVAYYGENDKYLGYNYVGGEPTEMYGKTLKGTKYVMVAAGDTQIKPEREVDDIEEWVFERQY